MEGKRDGLDKGIRVTVLADRLGDTEIPLNHAAVPYPRNLTLIKQFARSIIIGREPTLVLAAWEEMQYYNIYVDTKCSLYSQKVRFSSETQAVIEDLDF